MTSGPILNSIALADAVDPVKNLVAQLGIIGLDLNKDVHELMPNLRRPAGVVVAARQANTPYSGPALETGDAIYGVNHQVIGSVEELRKTLGAMKSGQAAVLTIEREGHILYVAIELD
jgi:serine protease Do